METSDSMETSDLDFKHDCFSTDYINSENLKLIYQGAEAKVYEGVYFGRPVIVKERFCKKYRHPELDIRLSKERTKSELRCIERCRVNGIPVPAIYFVDKFKNRIFMEKIEPAITLREHICQKYAKMCETECHTEAIKVTLSDILKPLAEVLGMKIALMHKANIIHGDLTTSNILLRLDNEKKSSPELVFIDFGLSQSSSLTEDKAVDLYVLERALLSSHPNSELFFECFLVAYERNFVKGGAGVKRKLDEVRLRGRKRLMIG